MFVVNYSVRVVSFLIRDRRLPFPIKILVLTRHRNFLTQHLSCGFLKSHFRLKYKQFKKKNKYMQVAHLKILCIIKHNFL